MKLTKAEITRRYRLAVRREQLVRELASVEKTIRTLKKKLP